jgi:hypothetical protein
VLSKILLGRDSEIKMADSEMKILTDDPNWGARHFGGVGAAMMSVRKHGCALQGSPCLQVVRNSLTVTFYPNRSPVLLTIDARPALAF